MQIDSYGNITYNGEKIQRLLVDGEDIFGSDPTIVTRNFGADKIAKVQVLDRRSDHTIFTGIDDGTRTKTINLVLKGSAKDGYFGKVEAGGNKDGYYNSNGALAAFRNREQITILGQASNTGIVGFSSNAGGSPSQVIFLSNMDPLGTSAGTGIPSFDAAGLHYANTWNGSGNHVMVNCQYNHYFTRPVTTTESWQTEANRLYGQYQQSNSINQQGQQLAYGVYDWASSPNSAVKLVLSGNNSQAQNQFEATDIGNFNDTLLNESRRTIQDKVSYQRIAGEISWRIRIGHQIGRTFSVSSGITKMDNSTHGYLYSLNSYYQSGTIESIDTVDQRKVITSHSLTYTGHIAYTEPLWKDAFFGMEYNLRIITDAPMTSTFNRGDGKYLQQIDSLSSHIKTQSINQRATFELQGKTQALNYIVGFDWIWYKYYQGNLLVDSISHLNSIDFAPRVGFSYAINSFSRLSFEYDGSPQRVSPGQLQPIINNSDPLHLTIGNPALKPGLEHDFSLEFSRLKTWLLNLKLNLRLIDNGISTKTTTDTLGRQISQPINVNGAHSAVLNFSLNRRLLGIDAGLDFAGTYGHTLNYVNADLSHNDAFTAGTGLSLNKYVPDKFSLLVKTNLTYFEQSSSINPAAPVRYWMQDHSGAITLFLIKNYELNTNATYTWHQKTASFHANTSVLFWNAYFGRNFLHNKLTARFLFNNILNKNAGITRTNTANINIESSTNILGHYWMVSATYHFDKKFKK
ncbi:collagen-binding protein [Puia dinghuensis]|uniref:Collagen-binding protein n=2 Tax=Puia dinghuensis TaxID=1792502 RepID=A0A8J2UIS8_9BACT|nr:collagen-binding protein [Puia dinghuensis]